MINHIRSRINQSKATEMFRPSRPLSTAYKTIVLVTSLLPLIGADEVDVDVASGADFSWDQEVEKAVVAWLDPPAPSVPYGPHLPRSSSDSKLCVCVVCVCVCVFCVDLCSCY